MAERAMPSFSKSPPDLVERFATVLDRYPDAQREADVRLPGGIRGRQPRRRGCSAIAGSSGLPEADAVAARTAGADAFEPMPGRAMKGYVLVPAADVADDAKIATLGRARPGDRRGDAGEEVGRSGSRAT